MIFLIVVFSVLSISLGALVAMLPKQLLVIAPRTFSNSLYSVGEVNSLIKKYAKIINNYLNHIKASLIP